MKVFVFALLVLGACGSESEAGESCDTPGGTEDVCESGTICAKPSDGATAPVCIKICREDSDCLSGASCNGVEGSSLKGCRAKR